MADTIGEWQWDKRTQRLSLSVTSADLGRSLSGEWTLEDLSYVLDGLSRQRLRNGLDSDTADVSIELVTGQGDIIHLAGGVVDEEISRGVILSAIVAPSSAPEARVELVPGFQPIVCLRSHRVEGFEALARWGDVDGDIGPITDTDGLASSMLIHAAEALKTFRTVANNDQLFMQVNITSLDLTDAQLVDLVSALQSGHDLAPKSLKIELTEQDALRDTDQTLSRINQLRDAGAGIVLDDFGSGHSSFQWLADLPADSLKVDASLVKQIQNPRVETILEALTLIARRLGMTSTAEGVEDKAIMPKLRALGFDHAQGFALGRPMTAARMADFLTA